MHLILCSVGSVQGEREDNENSMDIESDNPVEPDVVESVKTPVIQQSAVSTVAGRSHGERRSVMDVE